MHLDRIFQSSQKYSNEKSGKNIVNMVPSSAARTPPLPWPCCEHSTLQHGNKEYSKHLHTWILTSRPPLQLPHHHMYHLLCIYLASYLLCIHPASIPRGALCLFGALEPVTSGPKLSHKVWNRDQIKTARSSSIQLGTSVAEPSPGQRWQPRQPLKYWLQDILWR